MNSVNSSGTTAPPNQRPDRPPLRGEGVLTLLALTLALDYADRALIGGLGPTIEGVFHIGTTQLGFLSSAFSIIGAGATLPIGMLTDRAKRTALLEVSLGIWTVAEASTGAATSFAVLFGVRMLLGVVAATTGPTGPSLIGDLVSSDGRGRALGLIDSGQLIGSGVGLVLAALLPLVLSWRWCFWLLAGTQAPLDTMRVNVVVPRLRGQAEAIRQVLRTAVEGGAPLSFGLLAASLAGGSDGLQRAFILSLPLLFVSGLILLLALRTYPRDVAAVVVSIERYGASKSTETEHYETAVQA